MSTQIIAVLATYAFCGVGTAVILALVNSVFGLRVDEETEGLGLDLALHSESAYTLMPVSALGEVAPESRRERPSIARPVPQGAPAIPREPPKRRTTGREPPTRFTPPAEPAAPATGNGPTARPGSFRVVVDGIDRGWLARWWRELCSQDFAKQPQALREIHPNLISFDSGVYTFRGQDPGGTRDRLAYLLEIYGAEGADVRVEG